MLEFADDEFQSAFLVCAFGRCARISANSLGGGILEGIDRLLFVADGEYRTLTPRAPAPAVNSADEPAHDLPLLVAGVLRLVDQHMIDAEIELVMHPGRIDVGEQRNALSMRSS